MWVWGWNNEEDLRPVISPAVNFSHHDTDDVRVSSKNLTWRENFYFRTFHRLRARGHHNTCDDCYMLEFFTDNFIYNYNRKVSGSWDMPYSVKDIALWRSTNRRMSHLPLNHSPFKDVFNSPGFSCVNRIQYGSLYIFKIHLIFWTFFTRSAYDSGTLWPSWLQTRHFLLWYRRLSTFHRKLLPPSVENKV